MIKNSKISQGCRNDDYLDANNNDENDSVSELKINRNCNDKLASRVLTWNVKKSKHVYNDANELMRSQSMRSLRSFNLEVNQAHPYMNGKNNDSYNNNNLFGQIERNALHSNVRRYAISYLNGSKNFVINPLYDENGTDC